MVSTENVEKAYKEAKERYAAIGVDTDKVLKKLKKVKLSVHCWQGDDIHGFLNPSQELTGGIGVSGNYPGIARTPDELTSDLSEALSLIPGSHKVQLHAIYAVTNGKKKGINDIGPEDFSYWVDWAKKEKVGLDMNGTFFSHSMVKNNFTLASPDKDVRDFWIEHGKRSRKIAEYFGKELGQKSYNNFWVPDGMKDNPIDRLSPRKRLMESYDEIFSDVVDSNYTEDTVESKLFGIGAEAYTVGSHEFYMGYGISRNKTVLMDAGHYHPTEVVSNKISALALFSENLMLHVSRPVRWDSDHVIIMDDELQEIMREIVRNDLLDRTAIGLDFFDATINRIAAWVVGVRNAQKALLKALLDPVAELKEAELAFDYTKRMVLTEEMKDLPYADIWNYFCYKNDVPLGLAWYDEVKVYEKEVLANR